MSVDDLISDVIAKIDDLGLTDSTYFFFTSDNGFHMGQFNLLFEKKQVYEWDTKVHLLARGPGIEFGSSFQSPGTHIDLAPTILGLAGISKPSTMDGHSIVPFLVGRQDELLESTRDHLLQLGDMSAYGASWRQEIFIEYYFVNDAFICTPCGEAKNYPLEDSFCADLANQADCWCYVHPSGSRGSARTEEGDADSSVCYLEEDTMNNYIGLRELSQSRNILYAEFQNGSLYSADIDFANADFLEYYNMTRDPRQMNNQLIMEVEQVPVTEEELSSVHARLQSWYKCAGSSCP
jgi:hypothetical protein